MQWQQGSGIESKGDQLPSSAECRIQTQGLMLPIDSRPNVRWQTDWAIQEQAKNLRTSSSLLSASIKTNDSMTA